MEHKERIRTNINPIGLNESTPDNVVEDGALKECHNLRYANGAWRNVQEFKKEDIPATLREKDILYIHPVGGEKNFITKQNADVTETRIKYYGMRSQPTAVEPKVADSGDTTSSAADFGDVVSRVPTTDILQPMSTTYYLDKPLIEARDNPNTANLYDKDLTRLGTVAMYDNQTIYYYNEDNEDFRDGLCTLYSAQTSYVKLGEKRLETFYFISSELSTEYGKGAVFVKRGNNYIYFGTISAVDAENHTYAIFEKASGHTIACVINSLTKEVFRFTQTMAMYGDELFLLKYEEGAIVMSSADGSIGYVSDTSTIISNSSLPKGIYTNLEFSGDNGPNALTSYTIVKLFVYGIDGEEIEFLRKTTIEVTESDEEYLARYEALSEEDQIWGHMVRFCLNALSGTLQSACLFPIFSWEFSEIRPNSSIPFFYAVPALNITEDIVVEEKTALAAWDSAGNKLNTFGTWEDIFALDHFGNMLIVRDNLGLTTSFYLFSEHQYKPYGASGVSALSFSVHIKDSIASPEMEDVPMFYKASGVEAEDKSLDGRMFLGAGERALAIDTGNLDGLNEAGNLLLIDNHNGYFRGELALFVVARAEDGTEIYRTAPQIFRTETLQAEADNNVFLFNPSSNAIEEKWPKVFDVEYYPHTYLIWDYKEWRRSVGVDKTSTSPYKKWQSWKKHHKNKVESEVNMFLAGVGRPNSGINRSRLFKLDIDIKAEGNNIHELAIYSTRLHPLFVFENSAIKVNHVDILNEPFYEMKVLTNGEKSHTITYDNLSNLETKTDKVYKSTQSGEDTFISANGVEYNNRYHAYNIEVLAPQLDINLKGEHLDNPELTHIVTTRLYNNAKVYAPYAAEALLSSDHNSLAQSQGCCLSFDEPIQEVFFGKMNNDGKSLTAWGKIIPEHSSTLNRSYIVNINKEGYSSDEVGIVQPNAYWTPNSYMQFVATLKKKSRSFRKYEPVLVRNLEVAEEVWCSPTYPIKVPNRVQVSEYGNPLTNPYDTSYRVGTSNNRIIALNAVALNLSDAKFGEFPLYIFSEEGIYAMQTGKDTIYSNMIPIAKDVAINPNTLATSGAVFFFTEKGLHAISREGVKLMSAGLHGKDSRIPEWMYTCKLMHLPEYNEVMCVLVDEDECTTGEAYVLSIDNMCWSKRDVPIGHVLNGHEVVGVNTISDLESEDDVVKRNILMETRPIKLGANKELKRLETLIVRFEADKDEELEVTIKGSIDGVEYKDLRKVSATTNTDVLIRRTPASVKYLKFVVKCSNLQSSIRLLRFDTEHYLRFVRKMR